MKLPRLKWSVVLLTFFVTSAVVFGGFWLWQQTAVSGPLERELNQIIGVERAELTNNRGEFSISFWLEPDANLAKVVEQADDLIATNLPRTNVDVTWQDNRTDELSAVLEQVELIIREGQMRHEFVVMGQRLAQHFELTNVEYQLSVGEGAIYLTLSDDDARLYQVYSIMLTGGEQR